MIKNTEELKVELRKLLASASLQKRQGNTPQAMIMLREAMKTYKKYKNDHKIKTDVRDAGVVKLVGEIDVLLNRWRMETHDKGIKATAKKASTLKPNLRHTETKVGGDWYIKGEKMKKEVKKFMNALKAHHPEDKSAQKLFSELGVSTFKFHEGKMHSKEYHKEVLNLFKEHKSKHPSMYKKQPHGVIEHIKNAFRAMMRLLEKMFNYVTGHKSTMFKQKDSELGIAGKDFTKALVELEECEEEKPKTHPKK